MATSLLLCWRLFPWCSMASISIIFSRDCLQNSHNNNGIVVLCYNWSKIKYCQSLAAPKNLKHLYNVHSSEPTFWIHDTHCVSHALCWSLFALETNAFAHGYFWLKATLKKYSVISNLYHTINCKLVLTNLPCQP